MMNRKEFYEYVKDNVKDYLPDSYQNGEIRIEEVAKIIVIKVDWHFNSTG